MKLFNKIKKLKKIKKLQEETNDFKFINQVNILKTKIAKQTKNCNINTTKYENKIKEHFKKLETTFINKNINDEKYLETKKMAYNYHLYLLKSYYNELYKNLFIEKLSY